MMKNTSVFPTPLVEASWLKANLDSPNLVILDASMEKVGQAKQDFASNPRIPHARFMALKKNFADSSSTLPNTVLSPKDFELQAQKLGINSQSKIVIYDQHGTYSSPRAWWMFRLMGHEQIAVLNGGLPAWKNIDVACVSPEEVEYPEGNFKAHFQPQWITRVKDVEKAVNTQSHCIVDARNADRFYGSVEEPRKSLRSGHIPSSFNLPFGEVLEGGSIKNQEQIEQIIQKLNPESKPFICSCGSGVTASVLALALHSAKVSSIAVYDGSWSEWGQVSDRPVAK